MRCSKCGSENPDGMKFCGQCATPLALICPKCRFQNPPGFKFCGQCTAALGSAARPEPSSPAISLQDSVDAAAMDGERKTVTALFADIKGSMELMEALDPEQARAIVDPALKLMIGAVDRYDGYIVQSTGDGIFALFGAPAAHEDHPQRALYAALRMQEEMRRYGDRMRQQGQTPLQVRIGANTGEVVVRTIKTGESHAEYTPIGHSTSLASRLQTLATPGSVVIGEHTRILVDGYFLLKSLGPTRIKGVSEPLNMYEVAGLGPLRTRLQRSATRGLTRFVGRQREIEAMKHAAELARAGHGQIVAAVAEPGVGKSRLFYEFKVAQSGWMVLEAYSVSHGKASAYLPVVDLLHGYFRIIPDDEERTRREKVTGRTLALDRALEDTLPYLFGLLGLVEGDDPLAGMDPQIRRRRTLDSLKRILLRESLNQPLMLVFEDLHWIDQETQAFLNLLVEGIASVRVLLLVNYRPEYRHEWGSRTAYTQLRLDPLGKESAEEMLAALLGDGQDLTPLKRLIVERTEGTPFFMEEMVQALFEAGVLRRNGSVKLAKSMSSIKVPSTVQGVLAARIDRLKPETKQFLQTLTVIGRTSALPLIKRVAGLAEDELERLLSDLQVAEFIYETPALPEPEYTFKHALTQEVAYNSVLQERRKSFHERVGQSIEALYADSLDDHVDQLAHHYRRSANAPKAIDYVIRAAEQAIVRSAFSEAIAGLREGIPLLSGIADQSERERREAALQVALGSACSMQSPSAPGVEDVYLRARELCERIGDREGMFTAVFGLRLAYNFRAEFGRAMELADDLLKISVHLDAGAQLSAHVSAAQTLYFLGELGAARQHLEHCRGMEGSAKLGLPRHSTMVAEPRSRTALVLGLLGFPEQAAQEDREARRSMHQVQLPIVLALAEFFSAQLRFFLRDAQGVREHSQIASRLANQHGLLQLSAYAAAFLGWAEAVSGDGAKGIKQIRQAMATLDLAGSRNNTGQSALLIEGHLRHGQLDAGLAFASEALSHARNTGERYCMPELNRLRGELLNLKHDHESAETEFRAAIDVARGQQARWWELRATVSLARLLRDTGRRDEARAMLAEIYGWFTEGFDTPDLKDAKALLDQLSG